MLLRYKTSVEKWKGLEKIALELIKDETLAKYCRDVWRYIESKGDVSLDREVVFNIKDVKDFFEAIHDDNRYGSKHPCPHCIVYNNDCVSCPLSRDSGGCVGCCGGRFLKVKDYLYYLMSLQEWESPE